MESEEKEGEGGEGEKLQSGNDPSELSHRGSKCQTFISHPQQPLNVDHIGKDVSLEAMALCS